MPSAALSVNNNQGERRRKRTIVEEAETRWKRKFELSGGGGAEVGAQRVEDLLVTSP